MTQITPIRTGMPLIDMLFKMNQQYFELMFDAGRSVTRSQSRALVVQPNAELQQEQVVAVGEEELDVSVRKVSGAATRLRRTVKTVPVARTVQLHNETITVERRPANDRNADDALSEREYVMVETHEVPVVSKRTKVREEFVLRRDVSAYTDTVRDTLRVSDVEVIQPERAPTVIAQPKDEPRAKDDGRGRDRDNKQTQPQHQTH